MKKCLINLQEISKHYVMGDHTVKALDKVSLKVFEHEFMMIVGSSGSGKSSLMHILGLLDKPSLGEYFLEEKNITLLSDLEYSKLRNEKIGFIFQQFHLLNELNVLDNIAMPLIYAGYKQDEARKKARKYATMMGLEDRLTHLPKELSGGQNQRVAIARALVNDPKIIFADEPTGALDTKTSQQIMDILYDLNEKGHTIIMVTHDPILAEKGTRKLVMQDGKILEDKNIKNNEATLEETSKKSNNVRFYELFKIGFREGLLPHKLRTFLTMLGMIIGVVSVLCMSSFSLSSQKKQEEQIRQLGTNLMTIKDKQLSDDELINSRIGGSEGLNRRDLIELKKNFKSIAKSCVSRGLKIDVTYNFDIVGKDILGIEGDFLALNNLELQKGRFFIQDDFYRAKGYVIIGSKIAEKIAGNPLGESLVLGNDYYKIIGVLKEKKTINNDDIKIDENINNVVLMPLPSLLHRTNYTENRSEIDNIYLQFDTEKNLLGNNDRVHKFMIDLHRGLEDFEIVIPLELLQQQQQSKKLLRILTLCISFVSIIVGGIGIMNIMLSSVNERIGEIGIRRAMGANKKNIRHQFLLESIIISFTGAFLGLVLSIVAIAFFCFYFSYPFVLSGTLVGVSISISILTGLIFGIYPAYNAANKNLVEALLHD